MIVKRMVKAIWRRVSHRMAGLVGRDAFTLEKVQKRRDLVAVGSRYGGWVIPVDLLGPNSICYCVGCGEDITFDIGLIERFGCDVYAFDPTPRAIAHVEKFVLANSNKYHFAPIGLWDDNTSLKFYAPKQGHHVSYSILNLQGTSEYFEATVKRLKDVMERNGHEYIDLLKLDIEGAEYRVVESIINDNLDINILCIEYDEFFNPLDSMYKERITSSVKVLLEAGYVLVHSQGNCNYTLVKSRGSSH